MSGIQAHMKIALVTGANKGIGREVARQLAAKGFHVFIGARNRSAGRKAADEIAKKGGRSAMNYYERRWRQIRLVRCG